MYIIGIGCDIVNKKDVNKLWCKFGERFARQLLTPREMEDFKKRHRLLDYLAGRFAAKEAVAKAMGTGLLQSATWLGVPVKWKDLSILNDHTGKAYLYMSDKLMDAISKVMGKVAAHVSISHTTSNSISYVILEKLASTSELCKKQECG